MVGGHHNMRKKLPYRIAAGGRLRTTALRDTSQYHGCNCVSTDQEAGPMVQMMPVLRAVMGAESMSRRHMCSRKVSAMAAWSYCV